MLIFCGIIEGMILAKKRKKGSFFLFLFQKALILFVWIFVLSTIVFLSAFLFLKRTLPEPETIITRKIGESTKIFDKTGKILLYDIHGEEKRTIIAWEEVPLNLKNAVLVSEDDNFYEHKGFDLKGIIRAFLADFRHLRLSQGGSTITQQLVKTALLGQEKTFSRKIKEAVLAVEIERRFSKDQIFWMYLNQIPFGSNAYGVQTAGEAFFNKNASALSTAEAATLAALIRATTYYSPYGNHVPELMARKDGILKKMKESGYLNEEEYKLAVQEQIVFSPPSEKIPAPHFVIMVKEYLIKKYGEETVQNGGFNIITTLDAKLQLLAEETVSKYAAINKERYKAKNASLVAIDPKTGEVLALVGSADYYDLENDGNFNVATANRQPGSAFKPFAYAAAVNKDYADYSLVFDLKTEFNPNCLPDGSQEKDQYGLDCYHPKNYDDSFRGPVTLRQALAQSLNLPSVKTLYLAGVDNTMDLAEKMGISTLGDRSRFGLSLVLGGAEVKLTDLVSAYGVFANDGVRNPWYFIQTIKTSGGQILEEERNNPVRVLPEQTARIINNILSDNSARAPMFGYSSSLYLPGFSVAAKTGTTQENRDAWVVGYSPVLAVGVWTGNNDNESMTRQGAGISAAGPMWNQFMVKALSDFPNENFVNPPPIINNKIMLDGNYFYKKTGDSKPEVHSILYFVDRGNPLGPFPIEPQKDSQFNNWEWAVNKYYPQ